MRSARAVAFCLVVAACSPSHLEPLTPPAPLTSLGTTRLLLELDVGGTAVSLDLTRKTELVSPDFKVLVVDGEQVTERAVRTDCFYDGEVRPRSGAPTQNSWAALSTCDGLRGIVVLDGVAWSVEPGATPDEVLVRPAVREPQAPV
ncbi:MAG: hypothetical protein JNM69_12995, partial [Archangium sp.]|nr:hypothetical protein [Archangium sp.]